MSSVTGIHASSCLVQLDSNGAILNDAMFRPNSSADYIAKASKVVTLVDLAGHERYFKTTAYGLTGHLPDYACLIVGANAGVPIDSSRLTTEALPSVEHQRHWHNLDMMGVLVQ